MNEHDPILRAMSKLRYIISNPITLERRFNLISDIKTLRTAAKVSRTPEVRTSLFHFSVTMAKLLEREKN